MKTWTSGAERYWEGRWRDTDKELTQLQQDHNTVLDLYEQILELTTRLAKKAA